MTEIKGHFQTFSFQTEPLFNGILISEKSNCTNAPIRHQPTYCTNSTLPLDRLFGPSPDRLGGGRRDLGVGDGGGGRQHRRVAIRRSLTEPEMRRPYGSPIQEIIGEGDEG